MEPSLETAIKGNPGSPEGGSSRYSATTLCVPQKENTPRVSCVPHDPADSVSRHDLLKIRDEPTGSMPDVHQVEEAQAGSMEEVASASLSPS